MFPFYNHYPGTDLHEIDLAYILKLCAELRASNIDLKAWKAAHEVEYQELKEAVDGLVNQLVDVIVPWDSSIEYPIYSIVEYQGTNYIAVQNVPVGAMITDTTYWQPANTVIQQINAIGTVVSDLQDNLYYTTPQEFGAVGDGVTDDTAAIQAALNNAKQYVYIPKGQYLISNTITIPSGTVIYGTPKSRIIPDDTFTGNYMFEILGERTNFTIDTLYIACESKNVGGIYAQRPYNECVIRNVIIDNCYNTALYVGVDTTDVSQTLLVDNCIFLASDSIDSISPLCVMNRVFELNLTNTKIMYRQARISTQPCLLLNYCWDPFIRGCSFAFTSVCGVRFTDRTRYIRMIGNTYENVGYTDAYNGTAHVDHLIEIIGLNDAYSNDGVIIETPYYNTSKTIYLSHAQYISIIGRLNIEEANGSMRNFLIKTDYGSNTGGSFKMFINGNWANVSNIFNLALPTDDQDYLSIRHTAAIPFELRNGSGGNETAILRVSNNNIYNMSNNGGLMLKDTNGTNHFIRVDTDGNIVVTDN